ncbi:hypothetical protein N7495_008155 [Penicillium taxi]|uniref:uncharacterized protein n=1 Tax=Penicillium taxi TaxID=168475 RepID=UPI00254501C2|nr:uncharacterized protein N7495_008155 [Penicillium taxi]KAJ5888114.1 hypothetical protein N7495_008155 [Penicillium taxi]
MAKSKKADSKPQSTTTTQPPNWPPLRPLLPPQDLTLTPLLPSQIYLIRNFLPSTLCKTYAQFLASLPLTTTPGKPKKGDAVRVNDRFQVQDARFAEMLWSGTALKELVTERFVEDGYGEDDGSNNDNKTVDLMAKMKNAWGGVPLGA